MSSFYFQMEIGHQNFSNHHFPHDFLRIFWGFPMGFPPIPSPGGFERIWIDLKMDSSLIHREILVIFHRKLWVLQEGQWLSTSLTGHLFEPQIPERQESQEPDHVSRRGHVPGVRLAAPLFQVFQVFNHLGTLGEDKGWLVVWNMAFIFHNIWDNPAHWLIFFKMVKTC